VVRLLFALALSCFGLLPSCAPGQGEDNAAPRFAPCDVQLGELAEDSDRVKFDVSLVNPLSNGLVFPSMRASCGCVVLSEAPKSLSRAAQTIIPISMDVSRLVGPFEQFVVLSWRTCDGSHSGELKLAIHGIRKSSEILVEPRRVFLRTPGIAGARSLELRARDGRSVISGDFSVEARNDFVISTTPSELRALCVTIQPPNSWPGASVVWLTGLARCSDGKSVRLRVPIECVGDGTPDPVQVFLGTIESGKSWKVRLPIDQVGVGAPLVHLEPDDFVVVESTVVGASDVGSGRSAVALTVEPRTSVSGLRRCKITYGWPTGMKVAIVTYRLVQSK
jgi:hypothetical protein